MMTAQHQGLMSDFGPVGVGIGGFRGATASDICDLAALAEGLGYGSVWVSEDYGHEAFSLLGAMAVRTGRIRLGTGIVGIFSRTAALTAQAVATLDQASGGRAFLGVGLGDLGLARDWHAGSTKGLADQLRDYVGVVRALLGGAGDYSGKSMRGRRLKLAFEPPRKDIPIFVASLSEQTLSVVDEHSDGWLPMAVPLSRVRRVRERLGPDKPVALYTVCSVSDDRAAARESARMMLTYFLALMPPLRRAVTDAVPEDRLEDLVSRWRNGERREAAQMLDDDALDSLSVSGTPAECRERLGAYDAEGVYPIIAPPYRSSRADIETTLRALAPQR